MTRRHHLLRYLAGVVFFCIASIAMARPLVLALGGEPDEGFDPVMGWGIYGSPLFQSTLLKRDNSFKLQPDLAETVTVSEDGLIWKVSLRPDAKFSDGQPLTSKDVVFTFEKARVSGSRNDLTMLSAVKAIDQYTVEFTLAEPSSLFWGRLSTLGIVPAAYYDKNYASHPLGSGPFQIVEWQRGRQLIVKPNPYYYGKKSPFEKITFLFGANESLVMKARRGGIDVVSIPVSLASVPFRGMKMLSVPSVDSRGVSFPVNEPFITSDHHKAGNRVTSDVAIRKAINLAVSRDLLVTGLLSGHGRPASSLADHLPWGQSEPPFIDNQPDQAVAILDHAGWRYDSVQKVRVKNGIPARFELWYTQGDAVRQGLALAFADSIRSLGIDITVKSGSWEAVKKVMHTQAVLFGWGSRDPMELYLQYSSKTGGQGFYNPGYYANDRVDQWLDKAIAAKTEAEAWGYFQKVQWDGEQGVGIKGDAVWAWLVNIDHLYRVNPCLDLGENRIEPHDHGWPLTANILEWRDTCQKP